MKIYKVYDDEFSIICGKKQLLEFAESQVYNASDDFIEENLDLNDKEDRRIFKLANKILNSEPSELALTTVEQAKLLLNNRCYDVEEIEVY